MVFKISTGLLAASVLIACGCKSKPPDSFVAPPAPTVDSAFTAAFTETPRAENDEFTHESEFLGSVKTPIHRYVEDTATGSLMVSYFDFPGVRSPKGVTDPIEISRGNIDMLGQMSHSLAESLEGKIQEETFDNRDGAIGLRYSGTIVPKDREPDEDAMAFQGGIYLKGERIFTIVAVTVDNPEAKAKGKAFVESLKWPATNAPSTGTLPGPKKTP